MVGPMSVLSADFSGALARLSEHVPARTELMEMLGGILLVGGFAAIGYALPFV